MSLSKYDNYCANIEVTLYYYMETSTQYYRTLQKYVCSQYWLSLPCYICGLRSFASPPFKPTTISSSTQNTDKITVKLLLQQQYIRII